MGEANSDVHAPAQQDPETQTQPMEEEEEQTLTLFIAPPASNNSKTPLVRLEHVSAGDTVLALRQLIAEYPALAGYTCYRLEVRSAEQDKWCVACVIGWLVQECVCVSLVLIHCMFVLQGGAK